MPELTRLASDFAVAPQLMPDDLAEITRLGFRGIVNNRPNGETADQPRSAEIEAEAARLGLAYIHIPFAPGEATVDDARRLGRFLAQVDGPVVGFCRTGNRSTSLWNMLRQPG